jgi:hypothetical protein
MAEIFKAHDYTVSLSDLCDYGNYVTLSITNVRMRPLWTSINGTPSGT